MLYRQSIKIGLLMLACLAGQACQSSSFNPMNMEFETARLEEKPSFTVSNVHKSWAVADEGISPAADLAKDYTENGQGDMLLLVTYEGMSCPKLDKANREAATQQARTIDSILKANGVAQADVRVAPVSKEKAGLAVVSYDAILLTQPNDCLENPFGDVDSTMANGDKYKFGCERARLMSQMVSRKKDMLGNTHMSATPSAPMGAAIEAYNSGESVGQGDLNVITSEIGQ